MERDVVRLALVGFFNSVGCGQRLGAVLLSPTGWQRCGADPDWVIQPGGAGQPDCGCAGWDADWAFLGPAEDSLGPAHSADPGRIAGDAGSLCADLDAARCA